MWTLSARIVQGNRLIATALSSYLIRSRTGLVRGGYLDWDVDAWAPDGTLLYQSRQMLAVLD